MKFPESEQEEVLLIRYYFVKVFQVFTVMSWEIFNLLTTLRENFKGCDIVTIWPSVIHASIDILNHDLYDMTQHDSNDRYTLTGGELVHGSVVITQYGYFLMNRWVNML